MVLSVLYPMNQSKKLFYISFKKLMRKLKIRFLRLKQFLIKFIISKLGKHPFSLLIYVFDL